MPAQDFEHECGLLSQGFPEVILHFTEYWNKKSSVPKIRNVTAICCTCMWEKDVTEQYKPILEKRWKAYKDGKPPINFI